MSKFKIKSNLKLDTIDYLSEDERRLIHKEMKIHFFNKKEIGIDDMLFYNFIRNKSLSSGLDFISGDNYNFMYFKTNFLIYSHKYGYFTAKNRWKYYENIFKMFPKLENVFSDMHKLILKNSTEVF